MTAYTGLLEIGQPKAGRDGGGVGRLRRGRLGGRADREDQGGARGRHRGRAGQVQIRQGRARLRRMRRSSRSGACREAQSRLPERASTSISRTSAAPVWDAVFPLLNTFARIPVCGLIAQYSATELPPELKYKTPQMFRADADQAAHDPRLHRHGFRREARRLPCATCRNGSRKASIKYREDIAEGLENAPQAFMGLLKGKNFGKQLVRDRGVGHDDPDGPAAGLRAGRAHFRAAVLDGVGAHRQRPARRDQDPRHRARPARLAGPAARRSAIATTASSRFRCCSTCWSSSPGSPSRPT